MKIWVWGLPGAFFRSSFSDVPGAPEHILATPGVLISGAKHSPPSLCALEKVCARRVAARARSPRLLEFMAAQCRHTNDEEALSKLRTLIYAGQLFMFASDCNSISPCMFVCVPKAACVSLRLLVLT